MFAGRHEGAACNAMMYSFFACCKNAGVNPQEWLTDIIEKIPGYKACRFTELLPHNWINLQK